MLNYTKEELEIIKKTSEEVYKDLESIWKIGATERIEVPIFLNGIQNIKEGYYSSECIFIMDKKGIYIQNEYGENNLYFYRRNEIGIKKKYYKKEKFIDESDIIFLKEYEKIRPKIINFVEVALAKKTDNLEEIEQLRKKFQNEPLIIETVSSNSDSHNITADSESSDNVTSIDGEKQRRFIFPSSFIKSIKFTSREKEQIKESLDSVLDDIRELWKTSPLEELKIPIENYMDNFEFYYLYINEFTIFITDVIGDNTYSFEESKAFGGVKRTYNSDVAFKFVQEYPKIRADIEKKLSEIRDEKNNGLRCLEEIKRKYDREGKIGVDLSENNIQVEEIDKKNVGTIDFGNRVIKIITDGDFVLANNEIKQQQNKMKSKGKL